MPKQIIASAVRCGEYRAVEPWAGKALMATDHQIALPPFALEAHIEGLAAKSRHPGKQAAFQFLDHDIMAHDPLDGAVPADKFARQAKHRIPAIPLEQDPTAIASGQNGGEKQQKQRKQATPETS